MGAAEFLVAWGIPFSFALALHLFETVIDVVNH
jgi:hypothetical protein